MLPKGTYKARAVESALGYASTGTEQLAVRLRITEGEHANSEIVWYGFFTEKTTDRTLESLRHLGWKSDDLFTLEGLGDQDASIVIEHEEDQNGEYRARVKWINSGAGLAMKERMDDGAAKAFAAKMRGRVVAMSKDKSAPRAHDKRAQAAEDDMPF